MKTIKFKGHTLAIRETSYSDGSLCLQAIDSEYGVPITKATVNLNYDKVKGFLPDGHVYIKNYSENKGMLKALVDAGIVEDTGRKLTTGFVEANLCRYLGND